MPTPASILSPAGALAAEELFAKPGDGVRLDRAFDELLARELDAGDLTTAWELVARAHLSASPQGGPARAFFFVLAALFEARRQGHTRLAIPATGNLEGLGLGAPEQEAVARFIAEELLPAQPRSPGLMTLLGSADEGKPLVRLANGRTARLALAFQRDVAKEQRLARSALHRIDTLAWPATAVEEALIRASIGLRPLVNEQRLAVIRGFTRRLALIAGGPGTGKTTIILSLVRTARELGLEPALIGLAAPTGKAARRIEEALGELRQEGLEASTLHGLLGLGPSLAAKPLFHADAPLPHRLVIVDEASMIGLDGLDLLFQAVAADATLVLLGDPDQLPSVEAGALFRALVEAPELDAVRLTQSHRMRAEDPAGATILRVAQQVKAGQWPDATPHAHRDGPLPEAGVHCLVVGASGVETSGGTSGATSELRVGLGRFFGRWRTQHLGWREAVANAVWALPTENESPATARADALGALVQLSASSRLLAVTRGKGRPTGVAAVNEWFHEDWARARAQPLSSDLLPQSPQFLPRFLPGEPVMVTENDAERGLANGDTGLVLRVRAGRGGSVVAVVFARGADLVFFPLAGLERTLVLAYAVTVHKAQGSEHDHVALLLPPDDLPLLGRELLYTALTRARRSVLLVGDEARAREAAARATLRQGTLADWLAGPNAAP